MKGKVKELFVVMVVVVGYAVCTLVGLQANEGVIGPSNEIDSQGLYGYRAIINEKIDKINYRTDSIKKLGTKTLTLDQEE